MKTPCDTAFRSPPASNRQVLYSISQNDPMTWAHLSPGLRESVERRDSASQWTELVPRCCLCGAYASTRSRPFSAMRQMPYCAAVYEIIASNREWKVTNRRSASKHNTLSYCDKGHSPIDGLNRDNSRCASNGRGLVTVVESGGICRRDFATLGTGIKRGNCGKLDTQP